ncbi:MAG: pyridoxal phosphate-dependent aminotransferase family protein [Pseudomonadota bacterium]
MRAENPSLERLRVRLAALRAADLARAPLPQEPLEGPRVRVTGREAVHFCSNDYLGLSRHPAVLAAAREGAAQGAGATGARLLSGDLPAHRAFEAAAGALFGRPVLLWNSGWHANAGALPALAGRGNLIFSDADIHASAVDGCRLSRAQTVVWPHNDADALERLVEAHLAARDAPPEGADLLLAESVYSIDGSLAPLERLVDIAERHGLLLYLDEAHGLGCRGPRGLGLAEERGLLERVHVLMAGLGKAAGVAGGIIAADEALLALLRATARSWIFSSACPPSSAASAQKSLEIITGPEGARLRSLLTSRARDLRQRLGLPHAGPGGVSPIIPVPVGDEGRALAVADRLLADHGILCRAVRHPTVPRGAAGLRLTVTALHTAEDIVQAAIAVRCALEAP